jgi:hypothetical protein
MDGGIHQLRDLEKLLLHQVIERYLLEEPDRVLGIARANLDRWLSDDPESKTYFYEPDTRLQLHCGAHHR